MHGRNESIFVGGSKGGRARDSQLLPPGGEKNLIFTPSNGSLYNAALLNPSAL